MNTIQGIIHDLGDEETVIGGCTTPGEVIITLQGLVEENTLLKCKLDKVKQARKEIEDINEVVHDGQNHYYKDCAGTKKEVLAILDKLTESEK